MAIWWHCLITHNTSKLSIKSSMVLNICLSIIIYDNCYISSAISVYFLNRPLTHCNLPPNTLVYFRLPWIIQITNLPPRKSSSAQYQDYMPFTKLIFPHRSSGKHSAKWLCVTLVTFAFEWGQMKYVWQTQTLKHGACKIWVNPQAWMNGRD